jgi:ribosome-binding factor A
MSRAERVAEQIKQEISEILTRRISDPRIGFTSVTQVEIGEDLKDANIFVSVLGSEKEKIDTMVGLGHASRYIRGELGHRMMLRDVPQIHFKLDESIEKGAKVFAIMKRLEKEREGGPVATAKKLKKLPKVQVVRKEGSVSAKSDKRNKKS